MRTIALLLLSCACATTTSNQTPKGGPRGLHADEHLVAARQHDEQAFQTARWPDRNAGTDSIMIPWTRSWNPGDHERAAAVHRSKADELHAAYSDACGSRPLAEVSVSPLQRYGVGGWDTQAGVIMYLDVKAGDPEQLLADLKCHRAWMMLSDAGMESCPLDLPGIQVDARGDAEGITLSINIRDPKLVGELHRRAAAELEAGARLRATPAR